MAKEKNPNTNFQDLKEKREELGLSLKDVFRQTRISVAYLEAIENGDFHLLPLPIYARNFINTYARFLGLDSTLILARYEDYLSSLNILENIPPADIFEEKTTFLGAISRHSTIVGIASFLIVITCVIWLISMQNKPASKNMNSSKESSIDYSSVVDTTSQETNVTGSLSEKTTNNSVPAVNESNKQPQFPSSSLESVEHITAKVSAQKDTNEALSAEQADYKEPSRLIIKATEETWIRIKADQKPSFQVSLKPGEKVEYKAAVFVMDIGNAGGLRYNFKIKI